MSEWFAKCWECGWESPPVATERAAHFLAGSHAISSGCPINTVRPIKSSEVLVADG